MLITLVGRSREVRWRPRTDAVARCQLLCGVSLLIFVVVVAGALSGQNIAPLGSYTIIHIYPHDPKAFTEGLQYVNGILFESTGLKGESGVRQIDLVTGRVLASHKISLPYFGEGMTILGGRLYELTWKDGVGFIYNADTLVELGRFRYPGEGWGLTTDGSRLIMSDGTSVLRFLDPITFEEQGRITIKDGVWPVELLNELEYVDGEIWANVWGTDRIARINPSTGHVNAWINLTGLLGVFETRESDVLNGIAYDPWTKRIFVTGKNWPKVFEIQLVDLPSAQPLGELKPK